MKTVVSLLALTALSVAVAASAFAADYTGRVSWKGANVQALHGADRAAVVRFIDDTRPRGWFRLPSPVCIGGHGWIRTGGGNSDLAVVLDWSERGYSNRLYIYRRGDAGELKIQEIDGWRMGLNIRDLNGDGIDELIVPTGILAWQWLPIIATPSWPAVYRLENGRYVEASRDFPSYYDTEVLPGLDQAIARAQSRGLSDGAAVNLMEKDKILRVLGRNPAAGLNHAYQWMNSDDATLMQCAIATFKDIGAHEKEVEALQQAVPGAIKLQHEAMKSRSRSPSTQPVFSPQSAPPYRAASLGAPLPPQAGGPR